ncbi:Spt4/RpoE2 zinc finger-domain-containing protein [Blastocladiella britannica]|nr:Spt4/RpoE2 zinc finger-domain-containing protein [Blastocladiella britannica]
MEPQIPKDKRSLRACMLCGLIKNSKQFYDAGCDNCDEILAMRGRREQVEYCTSTFEGTVALIDPSLSWVGKWQRINPYVPGLYAIKVNGQLPVGVIDDLAARGITYRPRDGVMAD